MGCASSNSLPEPATVVFPGDEIRRFHHPITAADLMIESPISFLVNYTSLQVGRRFSPLSANDQLLSGNVYVIFPMKRVNSCVTASDMDVPVVAKGKSKRGKGRISPAGSTAEIEDMNGRWGLNPVGEMGHRLSVCRSRRPTLETIPEELVFTR